MENEIVYTEKYIDLTRSDLLKIVSNNMSIKRFNHVLGVEKTAISLAEHYNESLEKASISALLHDYAKEMSFEDSKEIILKKKEWVHMLNFGNEIWHGPVASYLAKEEFNITDKDILESIKLHTTGSDNMSRLSKILYVADYIEPGRFFPKVEEARRIAQIDLDDAVAFETKHTLEYLIKEKRVIYPKTIDTYNEWVAK